MEHLRAEAKRIGVTVSDLMRQHGRVSLVLWQLAILIAGVATLIIKAFA